MKNIILILTIMISFLSLTNAQETVSFRSNALGNAITDDLDLVFDPIEIQFVDGIRLYTNLSNLTSTQEELFDNVSDDEFLIGISFKNSLFKNENEEAGMQLWHALLIRFENTETPGLDFGDTGTIIAQDTYYADTDGDGLQDLQETSYEKQSNFDTEDSYSIVLNNSINVSNLILGAKVSLINKIDEINTASGSLGTGSDILNYVYENDPTFNKTQAIYLIDDAYYTLLSSEGGEFGSTNSSNYSMLDVSLMSNSFKGLEFRGDLNLTTGEISKKTTDTYLGEYQYFEPDISNYVREYSESDYLFFQEKRNGTSIAFGGSIRKVFDTQQERKNDGFFELGLSIQSGSYEYVHSTFTEFNNYHNYYEQGNFDIFSSSLQQNLESNEGTEELKGYGLHGRFNIPLADNVHFGISGELNQSTRNRKTDYVLSSNIVNDINYVSQDLIGFVQTIASKLEADRIYDTSITTFTCPVGLEYKVGQEKKWALRFGSIFNNNTITINDAKQITNSEPTATITEFENGIITVDVDDTNFESISKYSKTITSSTLFTYGIGYNPTENLQIDLLGIGSSDFEFDGVRVSFTMKF